MADDLKIPTDVLSRDLVAPGSNALSYITTSLPDADAVNWFGKVPPDLSLITRSKGTDYVYRSSRRSMPIRPVPPAAITWPTRRGDAAVLSDLSGVNDAVFRQDGGQKVFDHFANTVPGTLTPAQYDDFVRDTVNFLDYVGEPTQIERRTIGIWVVLFLVLLTWLTWLLKNEYWKDVH